MRATIDFKVRLRFVFDVTEEEKEKLLRMTAEKKAALAGLFRDVLDAKEAEVLHYKARVEGEKE